MTYGRYHILYILYNLYIPISYNAITIKTHAHADPWLIKFSMFVFALPTVQPGQRPAAAVRGSAPPGSPRRVAPLRLQQEQQESLQREKEEAQQKEKERQAEEREKEEQREEVSCWWENLQHRLEFALFQPVSFFVTFRFRGCRDAVSSRRGSWGL